jgi:predicted amidohydrolase YtcJ
MENLLDNEIVARQWPLKELIDAGVHVTASSDAPVTYPNWKQGIQAIISRKSNLGGSDQSISRVDAIRAYTIEGAWQDHAENIKGSIEVGKLADICVIDQDILTIAVEDIGNINTLMTIIGGKVVFNSRS